MNTEITEREFKQMLKKERLQELEEVLTVEEEGCHWCEERFLLGQHKWTARDPENLQNIIKLCKPCFLYRISGSYEEPVSDNPVIEMGGMDRPNY